MTTTIIRGCVSIAEMKGPREAKLHLYHVVCGICYTRHIFSIDESETATMVTSRKEVRHVDLVRNHMRCTGWVFTGKYGWVDAETEVCRELQHEGIPPVFGITGGVTDESNSIHITVLDHEVQESMHALVLR